MADRDVDRVGVAFGLAFVVAGALFLLDRLDVWELRPAYVIPIVLIVLGIAIVLGGRSKPMPPAP